jgi:hypothetical protein
MVNIRLIVMERMAKALNRLASGSTTQHVIRCPT